MGPVRGLRKRPPAGLPELRSHVTSKPAFTLEESSDAPPITGSAR